MVFEESGGLVVVRIEPRVDPGSAIPAAALGTALGRPVREVVTLSLGGV
jgi:hypothetical protein